VRAIAVAGLAVLVAACDRGASSGGAPPSSTGLAATVPTTEASVSATGGTAPIAGASSIASIGVAPSATLPPASSAPRDAGRGDACPEEMVTIAGAYCPDVVQKCLEHAKEWKNESQRLSKLKAKGESGRTTASERCVRYEAPSRCLSKARRPMRFCMDRLVRGAALVRVGGQTALHRGRVQFCM